MGGGEGGMSMRGSDEGTLLWRVSFGDFLLEAWSVCCFRYMTSRFSGKKDKCKKNDRD